MNAVEKLASHCSEISVTRIRFVGIYFLIRCDRIVYVGQSSDIESRLNLHRSYGVRDYDRAFWIETSTDDLDAYEGAFIRALDPIESFASPMCRGRDEEVLARFGLEPDSVARESFERRRAEQWGNQRRHQRAS